MYKLSRSRPAWVLTSLFVFSLARISSSQAPDISSVEADLVVPEAVDGEPKPGLRIKQQHPDYSATKVYHCLYLPEDWKPEKKYPVIVEYAGNGPYKNKFGDTSTGHVEGSRLGYGLTAGKGFIWVCLPYLNGEGTENVTQWWGDKPSYDPDPTIDYATKVVPWICANFGGDPERVVLCGFSRGAIACNFIGLYNDEISRLWCGFIPYSHYDGVKKWGYPGSDRASALERLKRLGTRPQFVLHEGSGVSATSEYLKGTGVSLDNIRLLPTGFRNHNDAWILRPSRARTAVRDWLSELVRKDSLTDS